MCTLMNVQKHTLQKEYPLSLQYQQYMLILFTIIMVLMFFISSQVRHGMGSKGKQISVKSDPARSMKLPGATSSVWTACSFITKNISN